MEGKLIVIGQDRNENPLYGVRFGDNIYPVDLRDVGVRDLSLGDKVTFMTDRETGAARLGDPPPVRGCEVRR